MTETTEWTDIIVGKAQCPICDLAAELQRRIVQLKNENDDLFHAHERLMVRLCEILELDCESATENDVVEIASMIKLIAGFRPDPEPAHSQFTNAISEGSGPVHRGVRKSDDDC